MILVGAAGSSAPRRTPSRWSGSTSPDRDPRPNDRSVIWAHAPVSKVALNVPGVALGGDRKAARDRPGGDSMSAAAPIRVVVAEDDPDIRRLTTIMLRRRGYEVLETSDGDAALALIRSE